MNFYCEDQQYKQLKYLQITKNQLKSEIKINIQQFMKFT